MECNECHERPATIHFTQIVNGKKKEIHVCEQCALDKGYVTNDDSMFSLHHLLSGLFHMDSNHVEESPDSTSRPEIPTCKHCGLTFDEFRRIGKFGCAHCYDEFEEHLNPILRRVHSGNTKHEGKIPKRVGGNLHLKREIEEKKALLQSLVEKERFEQAAQVRDEIRLIEQSLQSDGEEGK